MKWFDRTEKNREQIVERIANAMNDEEYDLYEELLEHYSSDSGEYNFIEDTVTEFIMYGSHEIG